MIENSTALATPSTSTPLRIHPFKSTTITGDCGICGEELSCPDTPVVYHKESGGEKHPIHKKCLKAWLKTCSSKNQSTSCPTCRAALQSEDIVTPPRQRTTSPERHFSVHPIPSSHPRPPTPLYNNSPTLLSLTVTKICGWLLSFSLFFFTSIYLLLQKV